MRSPVSTKRSQHRLVVRLHDPRPLAGVDQTFRRRRLRRRKGHGHPGQLLVPAVAQPSQPPTGPQLGSTCANASAGPGRATSEPPRRLLPDVRRGRRAPSPNAVLRPPDGVPPLASRIVKERLAVPGRCQLSSQSSHLKSFPPRPGPCVAATVARFSSALAPVADPENGQPRGRGRRPKIPSAFLPLVRGRQAKL